MWCRKCKKEYPNAPIDTITECPICGSELKFGLEDEPVPTKKAKKAAKKPVSKKTKK